MHVKMAFTYTQAVGVHAWQCSTIATWTFVNVEIELTWANSIFFKTPVQFEHFFFALVCTFSRPFRTFLRPFRTDLRVQKVHRSWVSGQLWGYCRVPTTLYHMSFPSGALVWRTALFQANCLESPCLGDPSCNRKLSPCQHPTRDLSLAETQTVPCPTTEHSHRIWSLQTTQPMHAAT